MPNPNHQPTHRAHGNGGVGVPGRMVPTPCALESGKLDDALRELVAAYPGRWAIIRSRLQQSQHVLCSVTTIALQQRWQHIMMTMPKKQGGVSNSTGSMGAKGLVSARSPLSELSAEEPSCDGIQERLPTLKRRRPEVEGNTQIQPSRPPPSPRARAPSPPTFPTRCPIFLLAPDSALKAPRTVRRKLKCVYLAQMIRRKVAEEMKMTRRGGGRDENLSEGEAASEESESDLESEPGQSGVCAGEKQAVLALLARELVAIQTRPASSSASSSSSAAGKAAAANNREAAVTVGGRRFRPPSPPSPLIADQSAAMLGKALVSAS